MNSRKAGVEKENKKQGKRNRGKKANNIMIGGAQLVAAVVPTKPGWSQLDKR